MPIPFLIDLPNVSSEAVFFIASKKVSVTAWNPVPELTAPLTLGQAFAPRAPPRGTRRQLAVHIVAQPDLKGYIAKDSLPEMLLHDLLPPYIRPREHTVINLGLKGNTCQGLTAWNASSRIICPLTSGPANVPRLLLYRTADHLADYPTHVCFK